MIQCHNVFFSYSNAHIASHSSVQLNPDLEGDRSKDKTGELKNINLRIRDGEYVAIIGPNGCGKSTLAKLLNGILLPTNGDVTVADKSTQSKEDLYSIRQQVGLVFQNPENQMVATTIFDDIAFGLENIAWPQERMDERIREALQQVGMWELREREPHTLSGGQKQRVAIAGILAMRPDTIIFDEATSMLDPEGRKEVLAIMRGLHEEGLMIIHITHDMNEAAEADRVLFMKEGRLIRDESPKVLFADLDWLKAHGLELPFSYQVIIELKDRGLPIPDTIHSKKELVSHLWTLSSKT
ncbi:energy-coupling factor transporter ATPase [Bacillus horti]|uniref:Energy-coupling factor transport system ATP-binding protein n=1 Tax=Caldalkalibacillus horti TaxID=77523 RepID=A0ABT9VYQ3_9BACI|nr:energy-coupling factor transporter ATPase [Bacillus horti]MDQ0166094.1 energy-coupling factor transport system ATP-binding protein [Bacillus horti]